MDRGAPEFQIEAAISKVFASVRDLFGLWDFLELFKIFNLNFFLIQEACWWVADECIQVGIKYLISCATQLSLMSTSCLINLADDLLFFVIV